MRSNAVGLLSLFATAMIAGTTMAQPPQGDGNGRPQGGPPWMKARIMFQQFDTDRDGALVEQDVPGMAWVYLSAADANQDGKVTQEEVALLAATRLISNFDENEDGELTADEVPAPLWDRFESADADGSGSVSADEIAATILAGPRRGGPPSDGDRGSRGGRSEK